MGKKIISYVLSFLLFLSFSATIFLSIFSNVVLDTNFVIQILEKNNYYDMVDRDIQDGFRDYIYQSGFDETILENLYTKQELKDDIGIMISNLFFEQNEEIDINKIKERIQNNINKYLENNNLVLANDQEAQVKKYINLLAQNYENKITLSEFLNQVTGTTNEIKNIIKEYESYIYIVPIILVVTIFIINIKKFHKLFLYTGISGFASGTLGLVITTFVKSKITIEHIFIFNDAITLVLQNIINIYLSKVLTVSIILLIVSFAFIVIHNFIRSKYYIKTI